jgi:multidrug efflux pump subunit AcrA (membrane-fusion protein)
METKVRGYLSKNTILILAAVLFIAGCSVSQEKKTAGQQKEAIPIRVTKVILRDIKNTLDYVGDIKAQDEAIIYPKVSGKVMEKLKEDGSSVTKGEAIAYIDRDEVGFKFEKAPVESPLTGIIGRFYVDKGTNVALSTPIALVVDMDKVKINLDIPEAYIPRIAIGQTAKVRVQAYPEEEFTGEVSKISPVLDLDTRTAPIEILIPNSDHRLKSGMFAEVELIIEVRKDVPVVPKESILGRAPNEYVYVVNGDIASLRKVKLGIHDGADYEVIEGLNKGDLVVVMGQQRLSDGAQVSIEIENNKGEAE